MANKPEINPRMLTIPMVAKYFSATNWFVEELIRNKELPAMKFGKSYVVDLNDANEFIEDQKKKQKLFDSVRIMTDEEAQRFFEGLPQDPESGAYIMGNPDEDPSL
jgi:excisionase family DNA binding protein